MKTVSMSHNLQPSSPIAIPSRNSGIKKNFQTSSFPPSELHALHRAVWSFRHPSHSRGSHSHRSRELLPLIGRLFDGPEMKECEREMGGKERREGVCEDLCFFADSPLEFALDKVYKKGNFCHENG